MSNTADAVLAAIRRQGIELRQEHGGDYRGNSPLRPGSDSNGFKLLIEDGEHGAWHDHASGESGSLYELAQRLGVATNSNGNGHSGAIESPRYTGLDDYATAHGVSVGVFEAAGWYEDTVYGRPALVYTTAAGRRWRYLDNGKSKYGHDSGYVPCFYGLDRALDMAADMQTAGLVLCNGEASTVVAQHYGLPAFCKTSGEGRLPDALLRELKARWQGHIYIALDCDDTGRKAAKAVAAQWADSTIIDLGLGDKGDLADFCHLYGADTLDTFAGYAERAAQPYSTDSAAGMDEYIADLSPEAAPEGIPFRFPFKSFHKLEGLAMVTMPGKCIGVVAASGTGKTAFVETFCDLLAMRGMDTFYYGPEWSRKELHRRRVARAGGSDLTTMTLYDLWRIEVQRGVMPDKRDGRNLTGEERERNRTIADSIKKWQGRVHNFPFDKTLETTLDKMTHDLGKYLRAGRLPVATVFDYAQLLNPIMGDDDTDNRYEVVAGRVKEWAETNNTVAVLVSQVKKDASYQQRSGGKAITGDDALYLRDDKFNLFFTLNHEYEEWPTGSGIYQRVPGAGYAQVTKNSAGQEGKVLLTPVLSRYLWKDG